MSRFRAWFEYWEGYFMLTVLALGFLVCLAACCGLPSWLYIWTVDRLAGN